MFSPEERQIDSPDPEVVIIHTRAGMEEKQQMILFNAHEQAELTYLLPFDPKVRATWVQLFNVTEERLNEALTSHKRIFYFNKIKNAIALVFAQGFTLFIFKTGSVGIRNTLTTIKPDLSVPDEWVQAINIPSTIITGLMGTLSFSVNKYAVEDTLTYAFSDPIKNRIKRAFALAVQNPRQALNEFNQYSLHSIIPFLTNAMATVMWFEVTDEVINKLNFEAKIILRLIVFYFSMVYLTNFFDTGYKAGLKFWANQDHYPWLWTKLKSRPALVLQTLLQAFCSMGLRMYPLYFFFINTIAKDLQLSHRDYETLLALGFSISGINSIIMLYPVTYLTYWENNNKIEEFLKNESIDERTQLEKVVTREPCFNRFKQDGGLTFLLMMCQTGLGAWIGFQTAEPLEDVSATVFLTLTGLMLFGSVSFFAENTRLTDQLVLQRLKNAKASETKPIADNPRKKSKCEVVSEYLAYAGNSVTGAMTFLSTLGIVPNQNQMGLFALLSLQRTIPWIKFTNSIYLKRVAGLFSHTSDIKSAEDLNVELKPALNFERK